MRNKPSLKRRATRARAGASGTRARRGREREPPHDYEDPQEILPRRCSFCTEFQLFIPIKSPPGSSRAALADRTFSPLLARLLELRLLLSIVCCGIRWSPVFGVAVCWGAFFAGFSYAEIAVRGFVFENYVLRLWYIRVLVDILHALVSFIRSIFTLWCFIVKYVKDSLNCTCLFMIFLLLIKIKIYQ